MATLKFGTANSKDGFTPLSTTQFNDQPKARIVRELIQNSLDAANEAGEDTTQIHFRTETVRSQDIPDINGYAAAFKSAVNYHRKINDGKLPDAAAEVVSRIKDGLNDIKDGKSVLLSIIDNGVGLNADRMDRLLGEGSSGKTDAASGSYGVGHLAPISLSDIRYILYAGVDMNGDRIACGKTILASHPTSNGRKKELKDAKGYLIKGFRNGLNGNLYEFLPSDSHPKIFTKHLDVITEKYGHGCAALIPAFNRFRSSGNSLWEIVSKVAAYNFAPAIYHNKLTLTVEEDGKARRLDTKSLKDILNDEQDRSRAARDSLFAGLRPSGQNAYSILETLTKGNARKFKFQQSAARISLLTPSLNGTTRIDLFRNGMWITDNIPGIRSSTEFTERQPFHAVIEINAQDGGELNRLIRKAEGPMHDNLSLARLSKRENAELRKYLSAISKWIKKQTPETKNDTYTVQNYLVIDSDDDGNGQSKFSFWGRPTPIISRGSGAVSSRGVNNGGGGGGGGGNSNNDDNGTDTPRPGPRTTRHTQMRSTIAPIGKDKIIGSIASDRDMPEAWIALRVDENADSTCDRIWRDEDVSFKSFQIKAAAPNGAPLKSSIIEDGRFVKVQGIDANADYEVQVEYDAPKELTGIMNKPVLRLELHRPPPKPKDKQPQKNTEQPQDADDKN